MAKEKKDGVKKSYYLDKELATEMKDFCSKTGRTETRVLEISIREYLERHKEEKKSNV